MKNIKNLFIFLFCMFIFVFSGCSFSEKASTLKDDLVNITMDQVSQKLENSINQEFSEIKISTPGIIKNGQVNWDELKKTELANYVFYSIGNYEFRAILTGDGNFRVERVNNASGETYSFAEYKAEMIDGKFQVTAK